MPGLKLEVIRQKAAIGASPEDVYDAYVNPKKHAEFTGSPATGTPRVGGRFTAWDGYISGKFLVLERGKMVVHEWKTTEWPAGYSPSMVELTFKKKGKQTTELIMVHSKVPAEQAEEYAQGWKDYYWNPLKEYFRKDR
ncbi:MAG: SRPBCC domain-containing protein [Nitrososphaerales archaeon]